MQKEKKKFSKEHLENLRKSHIGKTGDRASHWKGGKNKCINCGKLLSIRNKITKRCRKCDSLLRVGNKNTSWKGDDAGYIAIHLWVKKWKEKNSKCEVCGTTTAKKYEWANIDHKYRRVLDDYILMCTSCHRKYDIRYNSYNVNRIFKIY